MQPIDLPKVGARIPVLQGDGPWPLSFAQERLWFLDRFESKSPLYNSNHALRLAGKLDGQALESALSAILARHEALRTNFRLVDGVPMQVINPAARLQLERVDLPNAGADELQHVLTQAGRRLFDLERDVLFAATLFRLAPEDHVLLLRLHHIAFDGWSLRALLRELQVLYTAARQGRTPDLMPLPIQYKDYAVWHRQWLTGQNYERQVVYWKRVLEGASSHADLPTDWPRPSIYSYRGNRLPVSLPRAVIAPLRAFAARQRASLFMVLLANLQVLLARYTGETDICVGSPVANRTRAETQDLIGYFANTLALRCDLSGEPSFRELVRRVWQTTLDGIDHQELPFERLVEVLQPERDLSRTPFFQVMFGWRGAVTGPRLELPELKHHIIPVNTQTAKFDLTLFLDDGGDEISGSVEYNTSLFTADTIRRMAGHFNHLLQSAIDAPDTSISRLNIFEPAERRRILVERNQTAADFPAHASIHALFEAQAQRSPEAPAIRLARDTTTYGQLNVRANRLAYGLIARGVQPGDRVGLRMSRSPELIVCMLGILKAGAAYVPLDPSYPAQRLEYMEKDAGLRLVLTDEGSLTGDSGTNPPSAGSGDSLAYVIYTSGSTGTPNGVAVPHRGVTRLVLNTNYIAISPGDVFAHVSNCSFDAATFEIWGALLNGACIEILPQEVILHPEDLARQIADRAISVMFLTTALFNQMARERPAAFRGVRVLLFGGEASDPGSVEAILRHGPPRHLLHVYGPTETTTYATWHEVTSVEPGRSTVPIGRPIANTTAYVLDPHLQPVPDGAAGELYVGGPGVARGYLNRPELTARRFVADTFGPDRSALLFRTGDQVRWLPSGVLEFLGRFDDQVKIRGWRIEPREIETVLASHPGVTRALVLVRDEPGADKRLIGYYIGAEITAAELRDFLRRRLPEYMMPSALVPINSVPLTPNGKVDKNALPEPVPEAVAGREFLGPRDPLQFQLAVIWQEILGIPRIDVRDSFFDLGGHSLLAVKLVDRIEKECGKRLPLAALFSAATIENVADALLRQQEREPLRPIVEVQPGDPERRPPFYFLHGDFVTGGLYCLQLARALGSDQPFYALQPHGLDGSEVPPTVQEMAADHVKSLLAFQPQGPYFLGGHCNGGTIAVEVARMLREQNREVALVAVVQGWAGRSYTGWEEEWDPDPWDPNSADANSPDYYKRRGQAYHRYTRALWVYRPRHYPGHITLLWSEEEDFKYGDTTAGWGKVADAVDVVRIAGGHLTSITTHVRDLAEKLRLSLDAALRLAETRSGPR